MEPEIEPAEKVHPGTMSRAERRARGHRPTQFSLFQLLANGANSVVVELPWQFRIQRDKDRHTPRLDGEPRNWAVEKFRRACGFDSTVGLADELKRIA